FFHQNFRSGEGLHRIGQQITRVWVNLEFDPFWQAGARGQPRQAHRFVRVARTARVGQKKKTFWIDEIENVCKWIVLAGDICAPATYVTLDFAAETAATTESTLFSACTTAQSRQILSQ